MEKIIESLPEERPDGFGFIVSVKFAQSLSDHVFNITRSTVFLREMRSGDEFTFMGVNCKCV